MRSTAARAKEKRRLEEARAELRALVCTCGRASGAPRITYRDAETQELLPYAYDPDTGKRLPTREEEAARGPCPVKHPEGEQQEIVILKFTLDQLLDNYGQGVQKPDRALPSSSERYLDGQRDSNGATECVTHAVVEAPHRPARTRSPQFETLPLPEPENRSAPVHGPPDSLAEATSLEEARRIVARNSAAWTARQLRGRASDHVIEVGRPTLRAEVDASLLPDCTACRHPAGWHAEFRIGGAGCAVASGFGGGGACPCSAYRGAG